MVMTKEQLLSGVNFRMKGTDTNTYRINGDLVEVKIGDWFPVAIIMIYKDLSFTVRGISFMGIPTINWDINFNDIEEV